MLWIQQKIKSLLHKKENNNVTQMLVEEHAAKITINMLVHEWGSSEKNEWCTIDNTRVLSVMKRTTINKNHKFFVDDHFDIHFLEVFFSSKKELYESVKKNGDFQTHIHNFISDNHIYIRELDTPSEPGIHHSSKITMIIDLDNGESCITKRWNDGKHFYDEFNLLWRLNSVRK